MAAVEIRINSGTISSASPTSGSRKSRTTWLQVGRFMAPRHSTRRWPPAKAGQITEANALKTTWTTRTTARYRRRRLDELRPLIALSARRGFVSNADFDGVPSVVGCRLRYGTDFATPRSVSVVSIGSHRCTSRTKELASCTTRLHRPFLFATVATLPSAAGPPAPERSKSCVTTSCAPDDEEPKQS